jgi:hypothetical protein
MRRRAIVRFHCRLETVEAVALQRVVFDVPAGALLFAVLLGTSRLNRQRGEAPVLGEGRVHRVHIRIEEAGPEHRDLLIVDADHARHAADVAKRALLHAQKRREALVPHGLFVAMPRVAQRHPKDPRPLPLAGGRLERGRAAEVIDLALLARRADEHAHRAARRRQGPDVALDRLVTGAVAEVFDEVLPDALGTQAGVELLADRVVVARGAEARGAGERRGRIWSRPGERFGRICGITRPDLGQNRVGAGLRAGERFGRICLPQMVVPRDRFSADTGLGLDPTVAPPESKERENVLFLRHCQVIGHRHPG